MFKSNFFSRLISIGVLLGVSSTSSTSAVNRKKANNKSRINCTFIKRSASSHHRVRGRKHTTKPPITIGHLDLVSLFLANQNSVKQLGNNYVWFLIRLYYHIYAFGREGLLKDIDLLIENPSKLCLEEQQRLDSLNQIFNNFFLSLTKNGGICFQKHTKNNFESLQKMQKNDIKSKTEERLDSLVKKVNLFVRSASKNNNINIYSQKIHLQAAAKNLLSYFCALRQFGGQNCNLVKNSSKALLAARPVRANPKNVFALFNYNQGALDEIGYDFAWFIMKIYYSICPFSKDELVNSLLLTLKNFKELSAKEKIIFKTQSQLFDDFISVLDEDTKKNVITNQENCLSILKKAHNDNAKMVIRNFIELNMVQPFTNAVDNFVCSILCENNIFITFSKLTLKKTATSLLAYYQALCQFGKYLQANS